jgi:hypothetical protein
VLIGDAYKHFDAREKGWTRVVINGPDIELHGDESMLEMGTQSERDKCQRKINRLVA